MPAVHLWMFQHSVVVFMGLGSCPLLLCRALPGLNVPLEVPSPMTSSSPTTQTFSSTPLCGTFIFKLSWKDGHRDEISYEEPFSPPQFPLYSSSPLNARHQAFVPLWALQPFHPHPHPFTSPIESFLLAAARLWTGIEWLPGSVLFPSSKRPPPLPPLLVPGPTYGLRAALLGGPAVLEATGWEQLSS